MTRRRAAAVLVAGLAVAAGLPLWWVLSRPPATIGVVDPAPTPSPAAQVATHSARLTEVQPVTVVAPLRLAIPAIGVDAQVVEVGVAADTGLMEVPSDVATVGWYRFGPAPGAISGSAVLTAHVDSRAQGRGAFFALEQVQPGDTLQVDLADGSARTYEVVGRERVPKAELPTGELFATDGEPRLVLITCGGEFDRQARSYADNVVVYALPRR